MRLPGVGYDELCAAMNQCIDVEIANRLSDARDRLQSAVQLFFEDFSDHEYDGVKLCYVDDLDLCNVKDGAVVDENALGELALKFGVWDDNDKAYCFFVNIVDDCVRLLAYPVEKIQHNGMESMLVRDAIYCVLYYDQLHVNSVYYDFACSLAGNRRWQLRLNSLHTCFLLDTYRIFSEWSGLYHGGRDFLNYIERLKVLVAGEEE